MSVVLAVTSIALACLGGLGSTKEALVCLQCCLPACLLCMSSLLAMLSAQRPHVEWHGVAEGAGEKAGAVQA